MARNFDLNLLPLDLNKPPDYDVVEEEMLEEEVVVTGSRCAKRTVHESKSCGLDQPRSVEQERFIAESQVYMAPDYAACAGPRLRLLPEGIIPYEPQARLMLRSIKKIMRREVLKAATPAAPEPQAPSQTKQLP